MLNFCKEQKCWIKIFQIENYIIRDFFKLKKSFRVENIVM